jgi:hypothetical protein
LGQIISDISRNSSSRKQQRLCIIPTVTEHAELLIVSVIVSAEFLQEPKHQYRKNEISENLNPNVSLISIYRNIRGV